MHALELFDSIITPDCEGIHLKRQGALKAGIAAACQGGLVSVTGLGRSFRSSTKPKHAIKRMDRLVGCSALAGANRVYYRAMGRFFSAYRRADGRLLVVVDWTTLSADESVHLLRASVPVGGRGLTLYEQVFTQAELATVTAHEAFLEGLAAVLPPRCTPLLISDAGFKNPWFAAVASRGWFWIGRIRGNVQLSRAGHRWQTATALRSIVSQYDTIYPLGEFRLAKTNSIRAQLVGYWQKPKGRHHLTRRQTIAQSSTSRKHAISADEAWLLATNLPVSETMSEHVIAVYRQRMQIEEAFRDSKNALLGMGLERARSRSVERWTMLVLIAALAVFLAWMVGKIGYRRGKQRDYQANTERSRRVLSCVFLGLAILVREGEFECDEDDLVVIQKALASTIWQVF